MVRVKRSKTAKKKRKKILKQAKGYKWSRKSSYKRAKEAVFHAWSYQFRDRKTKKRNFRRLWQVKINAKIKNFGLTYNKFINLLQKKKIELDRKILADLAENEPETFEKIVEVAQE